MPDVTYKTIVIFKHPKSTDEEPMLVGMTIPNLILYGPPQTQKGKEWIFVSTEIIQ